MNIFTHSGALTLFCFCMLFSTAQDIPGWTTKSGASGNNIAWANTQEGFIGYYAFTSLYTLNGGTTWNTIYSSPITDAQAIHMAAAPSSTHVVIVTDTYIWVTFDLTNFTSYEPIGSCCHYRAVCFVNDNFGLAVGTGGVMCVTQNGGTQWTASFGQNFGNAQSIAFTSITNGLIGNDAGGIYYTTDSGNMWHASTMPLQVTSDYTIGSIVYKSSTEVYATGYSPTNTTSVILHSTDGGQTWGLVHNDVAETLMGIAFRNSDTAFAVGYLSAPRWTNGRRLIYQSVNGGSTWQQLTTSAFGDCMLQGITFLNPDFGWIVGQDCIYKWGGNTTGFDEVTADNALRIYPNPANDKLYVDFANDAARRYNYTITDLSGRQIATGMLSGTTGNIDIAGLSAGIYFIKTGSGSDMSTHKFVKQ